MKIETNLKRIKRIAAEKEDENWEFRVFLKQLPMSRQEIDAVVHPIVDEVTSQIDCKKCANCCKEIRPTLDENDIRRFAHGLNLPVAEFQTRYLSAANEPATFKFKGLPCPFLENDLCSNYDHRPETCRSYPHLHKEDFVSRTLGVLNNYEICPIVFNVYERLKDELWHYDEFEDNFDWFD